MTPTSLCTTLVTALVVCSAIDAVEQERPTFRTGTRLVEISVIVTDRDRNPVPGLRAADFVVIDNGQRQTIELFSVEGAGAPKSVEVTSQAAPHPREFSNRVPIDGGVTVILFDRLNTRETDQMYARGHVARFLEQIRPDDRVGLYVLDSFGLRVLHDFTNDAAALVRAVSRVRGMTSIAVDATLGTEAAGLDSELALLFGVEGTVPDGLRQMREHFLGVAAVTTVDALESVAAHLAGVRGRKNLIWISAGFPLEAFNWRGRTMTTEISRATRALNDANVAIYTVDARGLLGAFSSPASARVQSFTKLSSVTTNQDILQSVAEQTGARSFLNTNDIDGAVRRAVDDSRLTYVLGYYPSNDRSDGRFHQVRVKLNQPGLDVRHREGYYAVPTQKQAHAQRSGALESAVQSPVDASGLGFTVRIDPTGAKPSEARLTLRLEPGSIALEQRGEAWIGAVDVIVAQARADGPAVRSFDTTIDISASRDRLSHITRHGLNIISTVSVLPDANRLRIVLRDVRTGNLGAVGIPAKQVRAIVP
jgi:VWFA-related protein